MHSFKAFAISYTVIYLDPLTSKRTESPLLNVDHNECADLKRKYETQGYNNQMH